MGKLVKVLLIVFLLMALVKGFGELFYFNNVQVTEEGTYYEQTGVEDRP